MTEWLGTMATAVQLHREAVGLNDPLVLELVAPEDVSALWRAFSPCAELQQQGYPAGWAWNFDVRAAQFYDQVDAIILPKPCWRPELEEQAVQALQQLHERGVCVIVDLDDDLVSPAITQHICSVDSVGATPEECEAYRLGCTLALRHCDGVTVSSNRLASVARQYTDAPVQVVGNFIDLVWWGKVIAGARRPSRNLIIGWAGGRRPDGDFEPMAVAWGRIASSYPHVQFLVAGWQPMVIAEHVPEDRLIRVPWRDLGQYPLSYVGVDIGCCPLEENRFNACKTPIKAYEWGMVGAAVVASPTVYDQVLRDSVTGYLATSADAWERTLGRLIESPTRRAAVAAQWQAEVERNYGLAGNVWRWPAAWRSIVEQFRQAQRRAFAPSVGLGTRTAKMMGRYNDPLSDEEPLV